ncbi:Ran-binding protein 17 [Lunasporangiospora selenospora]|uniref:Ran-binding protein 17 n=1 Tax=Lunasporangiospora selenospora TaxID=979761 RepID=A0A9P6KG07_9FUNG|nr:Ran-binding protein 17 [Lunasporangiospora selenospora]
MEQLCHSLYNPISIASRAQAEAELDYHCPTFSSRVSGATEPTRAGHTPSITSPIGSALLCRNLLEHSRDPFALMFATSRLKMLVEDHFTTFATTEQHGLRSFILQYIYQNPDLPSYIMSTQEHLFALITKLGWIENPDFRMLLESVQVFFQHEMNRRVIGMRILEAVSTEMGIAGARDVVSRRKAAVGFRDSQLHPIFQFAVIALKSVLQGNTSDPESEGIKVAILSLIKSCLSFDFVGAADESIDDNGSVQVPLTWKDDFEDPGYLDALWQCWKTSSPVTSVVAMECLSQASSIRRSIFSTEDIRNTYIHHIMQETVLALTTPAGQMKFQDQGNCYEFTRMLSRFRSTYQLSEICAFKDSERWLSLIGDFAIKGFQSWKWSPNRLPYLLTFWNKMVSSLSSVNQSTEQFVEAITVNITAAYLQSRLECVHAVIDGEVDDPLESEEALLVSLEMFANIARTKYAESGRYLLTEFKALLAKYRELIQNTNGMIGSSGSSDLQEQLMVTEKQLTWMVYMISACIGGRILYQSTTEQDQMDGDFACEVFGFIHHLQSWSAQRPPSLASPEAHLYVNSAIIFFYTQFRSSYIGEDSARSTKVYTQLSKEWGLSTPNQVLNVIVTSSLGNLRTTEVPEWKTAEDVLVLRTLKLFTNLSAGYSSVKYLRKLPSTKELMRNHDSSDFRFLDPVKKSNDTAVRRSRMIYYSMLAKVLFAEENFEAELWRFVKPWEISLDRVALAFEGSGSLSKEEIRLILLGAFRDLRGFVSSINNRKQYGLFFEWFYPSYVSIIRRAIEVWPQDELIIAILRFWQEFTTNKSSRITFDSSSSNGMLLFRETSAILGTYGQHLLNHPVSSPSNRWKEKYKGIMLYFNILSSSLSGKYANFGIFKLYGDNALTSVIDTFFQLMLSVPEEDMITLPKLANAYFGVIDVLALEHMMSLAMIPHTVLAYIFHALGQIVLPDTRDAACSTMASSAIDKICTFVINWKNKEANRETIVPDETISDMTDDQEGTLANITFAPSWSRIRPNLRTTAAEGSLRQQRDIEFEDITALGQRQQHHQQQRHGQQTSHWLVDYVLMNNDVLSYLFVALFQVVVFESRNNHWSLSRPLLGLILLNREFFVKYTTNFVRAQLPERQEQLQKAVDGIMEGVEGDLSTTNRDRFTSNITALRRTCAQMTLMSPTK